jgi:hypothetical protein
MHQASAYLAIMRLPSGLFHPTQLTLHQSSPHPSSLPLPPPFIALVPSVLGLPCSAVTSEAPKLSQKSCRSGATLPLPAALLAFSSWPSTNLLIDSAAPLALDWIVWPACTATVRACAANSDDAIYRQDQYLEANKAFSSFVKLTVFAVGCM